MMLEMLSSLYGELPKLMPISEHSLLILRLNLSISRIRVGFFFPLEGATGGTDDAACFFAIIVYAVVVVFLG